MCARVGGECVCVCTLCGVCVGGACVCVCVRARAQARVYVETYLLPVCLIIDRDYLLQWRLWDDKIEWLVSEEKFLPCLLISCLSED